MVKAERQLVACAVLSGNRNFEGRINSEVHANYLMSPALVVAFAIAGRIDWDPLGEPIDATPREAPARLNDIRGARVLLVLGDSVTTDHISPGDRTVLSLIHPKKPGNRPVAGRCSGG